jgi:cytochrome c oxidase subunit I
MTTTRFPIAAPAEESTPSVFDRLHEWVITVDHKRLGIMYIVFALGFLVMAGSRRR